jgi:hypothetical protein
LDLLGNCVEVVPTDQSSHKTCPDGTLVSLLKECVAVISDHEDGDSRPTKNENSKPQHHQDSKPKKPDHHPQEDDGMKCAEWEDEDEDEDNDSNHSSLSHHHKPSKDNDDNDESNSKSPSKSHPKSSDYQPNDNSNDDDDDYDDGPLFNGDLKGKNTNHKPKKCPSNQVLNSNNECVTKHRDHDNSSNQNDQKGCPEGTILGLGETCVAVTPEYDGGDERRRCDDGLSLDVLGECVEITSDGGSSGGDKIDDDNGPLFSEGGKGKNIEPSSKDCKAGETFDKDSKKCIQSTSTNDNNQEGSNQKQCPKEQILNVYGICVSITQKCPKGAILNAAGVCVATKKGGNSKGSQDSNNPTSNQSGDNGSKKKKCPDGTVVDVLAVCMAITQDCPKGSILSAAGICITSPSSQTAVKNNDDDIVKGGEVSGSSGGVQKGGGKNGGNNNDGSKGGKCPPGQVRNSVNVCVKANVLNQVDAEGDAGLL